MSLASFLDPLLDFDETYQSEPVTSVGEQDDNATTGERGLDPILEGEDLAWFIDYLDNVSFSTISPCSSFNISVYPLRYL